MKRYLLLVLLCVSAFGQGADAPKIDPQSMDFTTRELALAMGNVGGWWSFMTANEKSAFLSGYKFAMSEASSHAKSLCKILRDGVHTSTDQQAFMRQMVVATSTCEIADSFDGFEKLTTQMVDEFYAERTNQPMLLEWSLPYLRDKATGRKTRGQLLDALEAEQRDVHDCVKYPNLCKLGVER